MAGNIDNEVCPETFVDTIVPEIDKDYWKIPKDPHIVYEALSAIADGRFELIGEYKAKCTSTSRGKYYEVEYDPDSNSIMSNDNMAFYVEEISYPMVAMLLTKNIILYDKNILKPLEGIQWKEINQRNKNNYMKSVKEVLTSLQLKNFDVDLITMEIEKIYKEILTINLSYLGEKQLPPNKY